VRARLDQHFLVDPAVADRIVAAARLRPGDAVVEIGPGRGILTERLLAAGADVTAVEIDERLHAALAERFGAGERLRPLRADFLDVELSSLPSPCKIVSNLPYSVATPILQRLLPWAGWTGALLMFQKEVAERVEAGPGGRDYGVLSVSVAIFASAERLFDVGRFSFRPPPKVESSVVSLSRRDKPALPEGVGPEEVLRVVKAAFSQRRKMAANAVASALSLDRAAVVRALGACGVDATARAETISLDAFARVAIALGEAGRL